MNRSCLRQHSIVAVVATALAIQVSLAAPNLRAEPSAADIEGARVAFHKGLELRDSKSDPIGALEQFKVAHRLGQTARTAYELGKTHLALGELLEARAAFLSVANIPVSTQETEQSKIARSDSKILADDLAKRIPEAQIKVLGIPGDSTAKVMVDGDVVPLDLLAVPRKLNPGHHVVTVKVPKAPEARTEFDVKERDSVAVVVSVKVPTTTDSSAATVAGPADEHSTAGTPADTVSPDVESRDPPRTFFERVHPVTYAAAGVTLVGAIGWASFYAMTVQHYSRADRFAETYNRPICGTAQSAGVSCVTSGTKATAEDQAREEVAAGDETRTAATVFAVVSIVGLGVTVATYVLVQKTDERGVALIAAPTVGGAALSFVGRF